MPRPEQIKAQRLARMDEKNDAELVVMLKQEKARYGGTVKNLNPDSFHKLRKTIQTQDPEPELRLSGHGFRAGDPVKMSREGIMNAALVGDKIHGQIQGVLGRFVRVNGRLYDPGIWRKA